MQGTCTTCCVVVAVWQVVGVVLHLRDQHDAAFRARARQARGHAIETGGSAAAGEETAVFVGVGVDELEYAFVRPFKGMAGAAGSVVQVRMRAGVMRQEFVSNLVGWCHHQGGGGRVEVDAWAALAVDRRVLGMAADKTRLQLCQKRLVAHILDLSDKGCIVA